MIDEMQVRNMALIKEARLVPSRGLTVLTGETGAGKSAMLSAMKLLMGARADKDMIREGEDALQVTGRFFGLRPVGEDADEGETAACEDDAGEAAGFDDGVVVSRKVGVDGRSRATIDGAMASMRQVAALVAPSIDLCGQFEHQQLMKPANHVGMLDAWAGPGVGQALEAYQRAFAAAVQAGRELKRVQDAQAVSNAKIDDARFILNRIDEVKPQPGEYEQLIASLDIAEHAEALATAVNAAHSALAGDDGALDKLNTAASALEGVASVDASLGQLAQSLREAGYALEDAAAETRDYRDKVEFDPETLADQQERVARMQGLMRAYGPTMEDVLAARDEAWDTVSLVDDAQVRERAAKQAVAVAEEALASAADALDAARNEAAPQFSNKVSAVMGKLEMGGAQLVCESTRLPRAQWTSTGPSNVEFMYRPGAGMTARPLARIASGGEVSRVMLAVKVVLGAVDTVDTLVFDEVDAGVGGQTAVALADVIADLAKTHQVIVVTHLAQVAVRADKHYVVRRAGAQDLPETQMEEVEGNQRVEEIARMLSGDATEASLAHARQMLADAGMPA